MPSDACADNKVGPLADFDVTGAVLLWISTSAHRSSLGMLSLEIEIFADALGRMRRQQSEGMSPFFRTRMIGKTLTRVTAGTRLGVSGASLSPTEDCVLILISRYRHDRSCLEMSEADGVDGGAFRKRGLTHLQWAEKPEAPEAERHLGTRIVE
ncbi:hypothetical protein V1478_001385 [Vespula squamosa]|uniref:Uncharacterized protein n=1 Tax=Vespula squamosa TaxID=30214 RepID=A0ABD2C1B5_VESSQ